MSTRRQLEQRLRQLEDQIQTCGFFETEEEAEAAHQEVEQIQQELAGLPAEPAPIVEVQVAELRATPGQDISWKSATLGRVVSFFELEELSPPEVELLYSELAGGMATRAKARNRSEHPQEVERLEKERSILSALLNRLRFVRNYKGSTPGPDHTSGAPETSVDREPLDDMEKKIQGLRTNTKSLEAALQKQKEANRLLQKQQAYAALDEERFNLRKQLKRTAALVGDIHAMAEEQSLESAFVEVAHDNLPADQFAALMGTAARNFNRRRLQRLARFGELVEQLCPHIETVTTIARGAEQQVEQQLAEQLVDQQSPAPA